MKWGGKKKCVSTSECVPKQIRHITTYEKKTEGQQLNAKGRKERKEEEKVRKEGESKEAGGGPQWKSRGEEKRKRTKGLSELCYQHQWVDQIQNGTHGRQRTKGDDFPRAKNA